MLKRSTMLSLIGLMAFGFTDTTLAGGPISSGGSPTNGGTFCNASKCWSLTNDPNGSFFMTCVSGSCVPGSVWDAATGQCISGCTPPTSSSGTPPTSSSGTGTGKGNGTSGTTSDGNGGT